MNKQHEDLAWEQFLRDMASSGQTVYTIPTIPELQAKQAAGTITPEEEQELQRMLARRGGTR